MTNTHKKLPALAVFTALALTGTSLAEPSARIAPIKIRPHTVEITPDLVGPSRIDPDRILKLTAKPDLAVTKVGVRPSTTTGKTWLMVSVKNVGRAHWRSAPNQQSVMAYINRRSFLVSRNIKSLNAGQTRSFSIEVPSYWARGIEFPPSVLVQILMDPDIRNDGNPANDDANPSNNRRTLSGTAANAMVGG